MSVSTNGTSGHDFFPSRDPGAYPGESFVSADVGSTGSLDHLTEDVNTTSVTNPSGFLGKTSEATWMSRVDDELEKADHDAHINSAGILPPQEATDANSRPQGMGSSRRKIQGMLAQSNPIPSN